MTGLLLNAQYCDSVVPITLPIDATVGDLGVLVAEAFGVPPTAGLLFQGKRLGPKGAALADTGVSNECRVDVELSSVTPEMEAALKEAREELGKLRKQDVGELRAYAVPPPPIEIVMKAAMSLVSLKSINNWAEVKLAMHDLNPNLIKGMTEVDPEESRKALLDKPKALAKIRKLVQEAKEVPLERMRNMSNCGTAILLWVRAVWAYFEIYE